MKKILQGLSWAGLVGYMIIFVSSCEQRLENAELPEFQCDDKSVGNLQLVEQEFILQGDAKSSPGLPMHRVVTHQSHDLLIEFNPALYGLDFYDLEQFEFKKRIFFEKDGPDFLTPPLDFYWHNQDSIFFLSEGGVLSLMNDQGKLKKRIVLKPDLPSKLQVGDYYADPVLALRIDYLPKSQTVQVYAVMLEEDPEYNCSLPFIANYSLTKNKVVQCFGKFPEVFFQGKHFSLLNDPSKIVVADKTIVSFGPDQGIYVYNAYTGAVEKSYCAKSQKFSITRGLPHGVNEYQALVNFETTEPWYLKVLYDPYRNRYYRFAKQRQNLKDLNGKLNPRFLGKWSIVVLDADFNRLSEITLPAKKYAILQSFVAPQGLMIMALDQVKENKTKFYALNFK